MRSMSLSCAPHGEPPLCRARQGVRATHPVTRAPHAGVVPAAAGAAVAEPGRAPTFQRRRPHPVLLPGTGAPAAARRFAEQALRLALEVLDARRPVAHLRDYAEPAVLAAAETLVRTGAAERRIGPAVLARVACVPGGAGEIEVFGSYRRGERVFAVAACLRAHRGGWRVRALRVR